jgi:CheY-like chemotaxis protein
MTQSPPTILYVDDDEITRSIFDRMLRKFEINRIAAASGSEALDLLQEHGSAIALILMDLKMPKMNGIETVVQIRQTYSLEQLPIVLITASSDIEILQHASDAGITQVILKPITLATIQKLLAEYHLIQ